MRNLQAAHRFDRQVQRFISPRMPSQHPALGTQDAENLRPIKPLAFTMLAEAHRTSLVSVLSSGSDSRILEKHPIQSGAIEQPSIGDHRVDLPGIPNVQERVRIQHDEIGDFARLDRTQ